MAGTTGLETATSDVTGPRSNQLSYVPACVTRDSSIVTRGARRLQTAPQFQAVHLSGDEQTTCVPARPDRTVEERRHLPAPARSRIGQRSGIPLRWQRR